MMRVERLVNGFYRVFDYSCGMSSLYEYEYENGLLSRRHGNLNDTAEIRAAVKECVKQEGAK